MDTTASPEEREAALTQLRTAEVAAQIARATANLAALGEHRAALTTNDLYDEAFAIWRTFVDLDTDIPTRDVAAVFLGVAQYLPEQTVINLAEEQFGEDDIWVHFDDHRALRWVPADELLTLTYPLPTGAVIDLVMTRSLVIGQGR